MGWKEDAADLLSLERAGADRIADGERLIAWGRQLSEHGRRLAAEVEADPSTLAVNASKARLLLADPGVVPDATVREAVAPHGIKADGTPKAKPGRKPKAERVSPLTEDLRAKLNAALASKPLTLNEIKQFSWAGDLDVEALLCEDPAAFVSWLASYSTPEKPVMVWGTAEQFDIRVGSVSVKSGNRVADVVTVLGCSRFAAEQAWKRLDPTGPNGVKP